LIKHGSFFGNNEDCYKIAMPVIVAIHNGYYVVKFAGKNDKYLQLGFKEDYLLSAKIKDWRSKICN